MFLSLVNFLGLIVVFILIGNISSKLRRLENSQVKKTSDRAVSETLEEDGKNESDLVQLRTYIEQQIRLGQKRENVTSLLLGKGWKIEQVNDAYEIASFKAAVSEGENDNNLKKEIKYEPDILERFFNWMKDDWILKVGAMLIIIGFGWFTAYAFVNNWIGPMGRISLGLIFGGSILILGWFRIRKFVNQGEIFLVLGSSTVLLTIFAARAIYEFFTPLTALFVMFLSTAFVGLVSVKHGSKALSYSSLILAGISPLLAKTSPDQVWIFAYLFFVILGAIWIVFLTGRSGLTLVSLIIVFLYSIPYLHYGNEVVLMFIYAFAALFFITSIASILKDKENINAELAVAAGNGMLVLFWIMNAVQDEWKSLIISAWMLVFSIGAFLIFKATNKKEPFFIYAGIGIAMLAAATSAELQGHTLIIAYTMESVAIALIAYLAFKSINISSRLSLLLIFPVLMSLTSIMSVSWRRGVFHKEFFVLLILSLALFGLGLFYKGMVRKVEEKDIFQYGNILIIAGSVYVYILLWLSLHAAFYLDNFATILSLIIYTIVGIVCYLYAIANQKRGLQIYGGSLIGFVVGRMLLVEIWQMELIGKTITFFLIGALLLSTAFLSRQKKQNEI